MAIRPFITAGVAFAAAGAVAATVAIAPPMSPGDVKVAKDTDVALNALVTDPALVPLINAYFNEPPDGIRTGATGVIQQLLLAASQNDLIGQALINTYFLGGATSIAQVFLTAFNPDPAAREQINTFFDGGLSEVARLRLLWATNDPTQRALINRYFGEFVNDNGGDNIAQNGAQGLAWKFLADRGLDPQQRAVLDTFWNAPTQYNSQAVPLTRAVLKRVVVDGKVSYEPVLDEDGVPVRTVYEPVRDANGNPTYDANGNLILSTDLIGFVGNSNPARRGSFGVLYNTIKGTGLSPDQQVALDEYWDGGATEVIRNRLVNAAGDPVQKALVETYFDGGVDEVIRAGLLAFGDTNSRNLINEFFDNGITGVIRYLLVEPPAPEPPAPTAKTAALTAAAEAEDETLDAKTPEDATTDTDAATLAGKTPAEAAPAPAAEAAPAPAAKSTTKVKVEESEEGAAEGEATNVKTGNKVEPVIILPGGANSGGARGGGAWGWKGVADRVNGFVKGVQKATGNAPAKSDASGGGGDAGAGDGGGDSE